MLWVVWACRCLANTNTAQSWLRKARPGGWLYTRVRASYSSSGRGSAGTGHRAAGRHVSNACSMLGENYHSAPATTFELATWTPGQTIFALGNIATSVERPSFHVCFSLIEIFSTWLMSQEKNLSRRSDRSNLFVMDEPQASKTVYSKA